MDSSHPPPDIKNAPLNAGKWNFLPILTQSQSQTKGIIVRLRQTCVGLHDACELIRLLVLNI